MSKQKTDQEYVEDMKEFLGAIKPSAIIVDPSAASFIAALKQARYNVMQAKNEVLDGIRNLASALIEGKVLYNDVCVETFREFSPHKHSSII